MLLAVIAAVALSLAQSASASVLFNGDWQTGNNTQWSGLECPHPATQFAVVAAPPGRSAYAARFSVSPTDVWSGNGTVRCLDSAQTGETAGSDAYFGLSVYNPSPGIGDNLLWALHHPYSLYSVPGCGLSPYALLADAGKIVFRYVGGNCTSGRNWPIWESAIPIAGLNPTPRDTWIDFVVHIRFTEAATGVIEVWARTGSNPWPSAPQISRTNVVTLPYSTRLNIHNISLYTEVGLYKGGASVTGTETAYLSGYKRGTTFTDVTPTPTTSTPGATRARNTVRDITAPRPSTRAGAGPAPSATSYTAQPTGSYGGQSALYTLGAAFHVTTAQTLVSLGRAYTAGSTAGNQIGLWDATSGTLLASVPVRPSAPVATLSTPLALAAGKSYVIGVKESAGSPWSRARTLTGLPSFLVIDDSAYSTGSTLSYPGLRDNRPGQSNEDWVMGFGSTTSTTTTAPAPAPVAVNLAANPGFETIGNGWYTAGSGIFTWTTDSVHSGARTVKIVSTNAAGSLARWLSNPGLIPVTPGATYDASAWLKTAAILGSRATVAVTFWDASGVYAGTTFESASLSATQNWTKAAVTSIAPAKAAYARVELRLTGAGTLWADDVTVTKR